MGAELAQVKQHWRNRGMEESGRNPMCCLGDCLKEADIGDLTTGEWWCFDCFELVFDRLLAVMLNPNMRELLPDITDRGIR